jgi:ech hydrogenase subunit A
MPRVSALALTGIAGMFIAPFGIVIAKWSAIRAFLDVPGVQGATFVIILAFGSALTIYYWGKLLLKILSTRAVSPEEAALEGRISRFEWFAEGAHALGVVLVAGSLGLLSQFVVGPWAEATFPGQAATFLHLEPQVIAFLLGSILFLPLVAMWASTRRFDLADIYSSGRTADAGHVMGAALGGTRAVSLRNYYLEGVVNGPLVFRVGTVVCGLTLAATVVLGVMAS